MVALLHGVELSHSYLYQLILATSTQWENFPYVFIPDMTEADAEVSYALEVRKWGVLIPLGLAGLLALGGAVLAGRVLAQPAGAASLPAPPTNGRRGVPHAVAELIMRGAGMSSRSDPVEVTAAELNGFLARHIEARRLPFRSLLVRAGEGRLEVSGRTSLSQLAEGGGWAAWIIARLPQSVRRLDVWVSAEGRIEIRPGEAEFVVERAALGRQPVPSDWLWRLLGIEPREQLTWRLPRIVERIEAKPDRLVIYTRRPAR